MVIGALIAGTAPVDVAAAAEPPARPHATLSYQRGPGAEGCPDQPDLERAVRARLGYDPFDREAPLRLEVQIDALGPRLEARLITRSPTGAPGEWSRTSPTTRCDDLAEALALAISLAIDPLSELDAPDPTAPLRSPPPAPVVTATVAVHSPDRHTARAPREEMAHASSWSFGGGAGLAGAAGLTPGPTLGLLLDADLGGPAWRIGVEARLFLPSSLVFTPSSEVSVLPIGGAILPCWHTSVLGACAVLAVSAVRSSGVGLTPSRVVVTPSASAGARVLGKLPLGPALQLSAFAEIDLAWVQTTVVVSGREAWRTPPVAGLLGLLVGWSENP
ncbi:MAG: hypothetical protein IT384_30610 [Deltaproteobacteria bacterium]|nr:hypothetical protein [Deltaproteobacteria bacterium]